MWQTGISSNRFRFGIAAVAALLLVGFSVFGQAPNDDQIRELSPNQTLEREIAGAQTHRYKIDLSANEFFQARVEQKGVDVTLRLLDANGNALATMDSPNGKEGPETLTFVAEQAGSFTLEVSSTDAKAEKGAYTIRREASRTATERDRRRVEVERVFVEGVEASNKEGQAEEAIAKLEEALKGWQELEESGLAELTAQQVTGIKLYCARGLHESISREERLCGVRRPFYFFKAFFLLAALWMCRKLGEN